MVELKEIIIKVLGEYMEGSRNYRRRIATQIISEYEKLKSPTREASLPSSKEKGNDSESGGCKGEHLKHGLCLEHKIEGRPNEYFECEYVAKVFGCPVDEQNRKGEAEKCPKCSECEQALEVPPPRLLKDGRCQNENCGQFGIWVSIEDAGVTE